MNQPPSTLDAELSRRLRTLLRTGPLHRLEAGKAQRTEDLSAHDLRALALRVMDVVIEKMGLGSGASRADVTHVLSPLIRAAQPDCSADCIASIVDIVLDGLLNERGRRAAFVEPYASVEGEAVVMRALSFHLLREEELPEGGVVLRASAEGVNVYAGMLDYDVEDAQAAEEAVLRAQLRRGRIADAVATARRARTRSVEYEQKLLGILQTARRDVSQVDWVVDVLGLLAEARAHLEERIGVEQELLRTIRDRLDGDPGEAALQLVELADTLHDCLNRHLGLHKRLISANQEYLDEQERQAFRPRLLLPLPDLEAAVLRPALTLRMADLNGAEEQILAWFHAPRPPSLLSLAHLVDRLLAPRRNQHEEDLPLSELDLEMVQTDLRRFSAEDHDAVDALLSVEGAELLSSLLHRARGHRPEVRRLLVLRVLAAWDPSEQEGDLLVQLAPSELDHPEFRGGDLHVRVRSHS